MTSTFFPPDQNIKKYSNDCPELTVKNLSIEGLHQIREKYMNAFKDFVRSRLKSSLGDVTSQQQAWLKDAYGLDIDGGSASEMLYHCHFAYKKCSNFYGREELVKEAVDTIEQGH